MKTEHIRLVQVSFDKIAPIRTSLGMLFYRRLFELDPGLRQLFTGDIAAQSRKLMAMLEFVTDNLGQFDTLLPRVRALGRSHVGYGVQNAHYELVGAALLWAFQAGLEEAFTPEDRAAWEEAYSMLATTMQAAAAEGA
jgi:hemoglobin-like flavoprotein